MNRLKHPLFFSTFLLTLSGILSRIMGFFYRIFLSRSIGSEGLGVYQMMFPIYGICFSLCTGSIQTAISRYVASNLKQAKQILLSGLLLASSLSLILATLVWDQADFIADHLLMESRCAPLLPILALSIPFSALHGCICGYFYGKENVRIPAVSQLVEQLVRIFTVWLIIRLWREQNRTVNAMTAVFGLLAGEIASSLFVLFSFLVRIRENDSSVPEPETSFSVKPTTKYRSLQTITRSLTIMAVPMMANRLTLNLLQSLEAVFIPNQLEVFGLTPAQALSLYGVLTGMAMPFILFPSAIVNSLAVILLPTIARQQASRNASGIQKNLNISIRCSLSIGILCIGIFTMFGHDLGMLVFENQDAGTYITILAWLCPFLYLATTIGSVLNGLGKTSTTFANTCVSLLIRLVFVFFGIPRFGIHAYLWGLLVSEILLVLLHGLSLNRFVGFSPDTWDVLVKPSFCLMAALGVHKLLPDNMILFPALPAFIWTLVQIGFVSVCYVLLLLLMQRKTN